MKILLTAVVFVLISLTGCASAPTGMVNPDGIMSADLTVAAADDETETVVGCFTTEFNPKNKSRSSNIERASAAINEHIVEPGAVFSYNETVGPTSKKNGYKLGTIFIKGKMHEGYGGGVCQVSSTLYNAAANAGMHIVERHDHSLPVPYIETGRDAATSYGGIDFKFQNTKNYPVKINSYVDNGKISVMLSAV